jgi:hypothetical protein
MWTDARGPLHLACEMRRNSMGAWCGYVDVPIGHPWHGASYHEDALTAVDVHGGLTYARSSGDAWRLGFDCAHAGDFMPAHGGLGGSYMDMRAVRQEIERLADAVREAVPHD